MSSKIINGIHLTLLNQELKNSLTPTLSSIVGDAKYHLPNGSPVLNHSYGRNSLQTPQFEGTLGLVQLNVQVLSFTPATTAYDYCLRLLPTTTAYDYDYLAN